MLIASSWRNSSATLRLLLGRGANPNVKSPGGAGTPLAEAAYIADADAMRTLIEGGAEINASGDPLQLALWSRCSKCVLSLATTVRPENVVGAAGYFARLGDKEAVDFLLDHGADRNARPGPGGPTVLKSAASSNTIPVGWSRFCSTAAAILTRKRQAGRRLFISLNCAARRRLSNCCPKLVPRTKPSPRSQSQPRHRPLLLGSQSKEVSRYYNDPM